MSAFQAKIKIRRKVNRVKRIKLKDWHSKNETEAVQRKLIILIFKIVTLVKIFLSKWLKGVFRSSFSNRLHISFRIVQVYHRWLKSFSSLSFLAPKKWEWGMLKLLPLSLPFSLSLPSHIFNLCYIRYVKSSCYVSCSLFNCCSFGLFLAFGISLISSFLKLFSGYLDIFVVSTNRWKMSPQNLLWDNFYNRTEFFFSDFSAGGEK